MIFGGDQNFDGNMISQPDVNVCGAASKVGKRKTNNTDVHGRGLRVDRGMSIACVKICIQMYNKKTSNKHVH
ncbi:hypothetical protein HA466_0105600 [Hirschfeldia incana]|nr:hypothetical protein HA466_0105600 [Hirschfeldia incana]KAJ0254689.1 hypothetical protein HA466_0105600 [Hirschfeldia incana]